MIINALVRAFENVRSDLVLLIAMAIVFFGFGVAKFAHYEQQAVLALVENHPLLKIGISVLGAKGFSMLLGVVEIITACCLALGVRSHIFGLLGGALGVLTFVVTLTIFPFVQYFEAEPGRLFLSSTGQFIMKDLGLLAASIAIAQRNAVALAPGKIK